MQIQWVAALSLAIGKVICVPRPLALASLTARVTVLSGLLIFCGASLSVAEPAAAELTVTVDNISPKGGILRLGVYTEKSYYIDTAEPVASFDIPAHGPVQVYKFENLPVGSYAIQVLQDFNGDGKMDFDWLGLPIKPFGFSRDAVPYLGRPSFRRVEIALAPGGNAQTIHLQTFVRPRREAAAARNAPAEE
jgi:uncharacterized protein (DUF2141 family)